MNKPRIMVVDDEPLLRDLLALTVRNFLQAEVETFESALTAYPRLLLAPPFDLLLVDYMMPGEDGEMFCRRIRNTHGLAHIPIVMLTASEDKSVALMAAGANHVLRKPCPPKDLADVLSKLLAYNNLERGNVVDDIRTEYARSLYEVAQTLRAHLASGNTKGLLHVAHKVHGSSATFGLLEVAAIAAEAEAHLKAGEQANIEALCVALEAASLVTIYA